MIRLILATAITCSFAFGGSFSSDFNLDITKTLAKNKIKNCGEYKWKNTGYSGEYWVKCTKDGKQWFNYTVWTASKRVMKGLFDGSKKIEEYRE